MIKSRFQYLNNSKIPKSLELFSQLSDAVFCCLQYLTRSDLAFARPLLHEPWIEFQKPLYLSHPLHLSCSLFVLQPFRFSHKAYSISFCVAGSIPRSLYVHSCCCQQSDKINDKKATKLLPLIIYGISAVAALFSRLYFFINFRPKRPGKGEKRTKTRSSRKRKCSREWFSIKCTAATRVVRKCTLLKWDVWRDIMHRHPRMG